MKFRLYSDLHLEFSGFRPPVPEDVDCVLLAGDIGVGAMGWPWVEQYLPGTTSLYTPGNHEYYSPKWSIEQLNYHLAYKNSPSVKFLQNKEYEFPDEKVVVLGCTLWTDFAINNMVGLDMLRAPDVMNDYKWINYKLGVPLRPEHLQWENSCSRNWLRVSIEIYRNRGWKVIVMTHHAPTELSSAPEYKGDADNCYYVNNLEFDFPLPNIWVHGHCHNSSDYMIGDCRVLANPRGYVFGGGKPENKQFDPCFSFDI